MATGTIKNTAIHNQAVSVSLLDTTHWEIINSAVRVVEGVVCGSIVLHCKSAATTQDVAKLGVTFPSYHFTYGLVTSGQWTYITKAVNRVYVKTDGTLTLGGVSYAANDYVTIGVHFERS